MTNDLPFNEYVPLSSYCTLGIGGPARYFVEVKSVDAMRAALLFAKEQNIPFFILGKGSNCLFDDRGFHGVVIHNKIEFMEPLESGFFHVGAGYNFSLLGAQTARNGWSGLEFASGIPATVGGAVFMNAGANGRETADALHTVEFMDSNGVLHTFRKEELTFAYRHSPFQQMKGAVVAATFALSPSVDARQKQLGIIDYRKKTQPYGEKSAGCIFQNPVEGHAGALIEKCGLKGIHCGGAKVSELHANFLVNTSGASCKEFLELVEHVRAEVKAKAGVDLHSEVRIIPYSEGGADGLPR